MDPHKTKPLLEKLPNSNGEAKMHKNMVVGLCDLLAKGAKFTIWPPAVLQPIGGPKTVLENKLSVVLYFWRALIRPFCITILYHNLLLFIDIFHIQR
jgi:hypothetical protein